MEFEWDEEKAGANLAKHGVAFSNVTSFAFATAIVADDDRMDYGEKRMVAMGLIGDRLHCLVYTRRGQRVRVISLRKANRKEIEAYVRAI